MKFFGTIEFLLDQRAAIVSLTDAAGDFAGAGRIDLRHRAFESTSDLRSRLYEVGYIHASRSAIAKGGRLERFTDVDL